MQGAAKGDLPRVIILMGVAGAGKTTVGARLAQVLGWEFLDADELLPAAAVEKLRHGIALTDSDRLPWLRAVREQIDTFLARRESAVVACSALRLAYRERLQADPKAVQFVYLKADYALLRARVESRTDHFFDPSLLESQLAILEEPVGALSIDAALPVGEIIERIHATLLSHGARG